MFSVCSQRKYFRNCFVRLWRVLVSNCPHLWLFSSVLPVTSLFIRLLRWLIWRHPGTNVWRHWAWWQQDKTFVPHITRIFVKNAVKLQEARGWWICANTRHNAFKTYLHYQDNFHRSHHKVGGWSVVCDFSPLWWVASIVIVRIRYNLWKHSVTLLRKHHFEGRTPAANTRVQFEIVYWALTEL